MRACVEGVRRGVARFANVVAFRGIFGGHRWPHSEIDAPSVSLRMNLYSLHRLNCNRMHTVVSLNVSAGVGPCRPSKSRFKKQKQNIKRQPLTADATVKHDPVAVASVRFDPCAHPRHARARGVHLAGRRRRHGGGRDPQRTQREPRIPPRKVLFCRRWEIWFKCATRFADRGARARSGAGPGTCKRHAR